jgi:hypothetical protein
MEMPKSETCARRSPSSRMLPGLMSRCRICWWHSWWRYASAQAASTAMRRLVGHGRRRRLRLPSLPWKSHESSDPFSRNG